VVKRRRRK